MSETVIILFTAARHDLERSEPSDRGFCKARASGVDALSQTSISSSVRMMTGHGFRVRPRHLAPWSGSREVRQLNEHDAH